ncbi:uncharacterized protein B0H18DRAFT_292019 [Fomitopsis serialis]|uniref:uncharacterized protein n=1 Tax=Fomitopsis serialis TaxID=139415 RepID=UPI002007A30C|nr:uncharacterized protein B0H18DRAFT_292019 [Neoantrodia serialis]KAH9927268.1 hypothetical protein B0H18DRAFT_292019 [Neoantrodia serialis]
MLGLCKRLAQSGLSAVGAGGERDFSTPPVGMWWREEECPDTARRLWREEADSFFGIRIWTHLGRIWAPVRTGVKSDRLSTRSASTVAAHGVSVLPSPSACSWLGQPAFAEPLGPERQRCGAERDDEQCLLYDQHARRGSEDRCGQDRSRTSWVMAAYGGGRDASDWLPTARPWMRLGPDMLATAPLHERVACRRSRTTLDCWSTQPPRRPGGLLYAPLTAPPARSFRRCSRPALRRQSSQLLCRNQRVSF